MFLHWCILLWYVVFRRVNSFSCFHIVFPFAGVFWIIVVSLQYLARYNYFLDFHADICLCFLPWIVTSIHYAKFPSRFFTIVWFIPVLLRLFTQFLTWFTFSMIRQVTVGLSAICKQDRPDIPSFYFIGLNCLEESRWLSSGPWFCWTFVGD